MLLTKKSISFFNKVTKQAVAEQRAMIKQAEQMDKRWFEQIAKYADCCYHNKTNV